MTINDQIRDKKVRYDVNREAAKISVLSSGRNMNNGEEVLPSNQ